MDVQEVLESISLQEKEIKALIDISRPIEFDVGLMTIKDMEAISLPKSGKAREDYFRKIAREDVQVALNQMGQGLLTLPDPTTILPRAKPLPKPKEPTKWERFAAKKGIKSNKGRDKLVYDEEAKQFLPRYGYKKKQVRGRPMTVAEKD